MSGKYSCNLNPLLICSISGIVSVVGIYFLWENLNAAMDSMLGVAMEGLVFSCILGLAFEFSSISNERKISAKIVEEKRNKRDGLIQLVSLIIEGYIDGDMFHWTKQMEHASPIQKTLADLMLELKSPAKGIIKDVKNRTFQSSCEHNLPLVTSLTGVAADISAEHLANWTGVVNCIALGAEEGVDQEILLGELHGYVLKFNTTSIKP